MSIESVDVYFAIVLTYTRTNIRITGHVNSRQDPHQVRFQFIAFFFERAIICLKV